MFMITSRRLLLLFFSVLFLIIAPLLIVYGLGYKYNWQRHTWQQTGVFFIKSYPKSAEIIINNDRNKKTTPTQITGLLPDTYTVRIQKNGYRSWTKNLTIEPQLTTFIEDVSLFYEQPKAKQIVVGNFTSFLKHETKPLIALLEQKDKKDYLKIYNSQNGAVKDAYNAPLNTLSLLDWSWSGQKLLLQNKKTKNFIVANLETEIVKTLPATVTAWQDLKWDQNNDNFIFGLDKNNVLWHYDLTKNTGVVAVKDEKILTYAHRPEGLIIVTAEKNQDILKIQQGDKFVGVLNLPKTSTYSFNFTPEQKTFLSLFDAAQKKLYLIDLENKENPLSASLENVSNFKWLDKNRLLYWNDSELSVFYPNSNLKNLVERTSQKIEFGLWHPNGVYVYGIVNNRVKLYELDTRDQKNIYEFQDVTLSAPNFITTNTQGDELYFAGAWADQPSGLWSVKIQ